MLARLPLSCTKSSTVSRGNASDLATPHGNKLTENKEVQQFLLAYTDEEQKHMPKIYSDFSFPMNEIKGVHLQVKPLQLC